MDQSGKRRVYFLEVLPWYLPEFREREQDDCQIVARCYDKMGIDRYMIKPKIE